MIKQNENTARAQWLKALDALEVRDFLPDGDAGAAVGVMWGGWTPYYALDDFGFTKSDGVNYYVTPDKCEAVDHVSVTTADGTGYEFDAPASDLRGTIRRLFGVVDWVHASECEEYEDWTEYFLCALADDLVAQGEA